MNRIGLTPHIAVIIGSDDMPLDESELKARVGDVVADLEYKRDSPRIRSLLLLFNLATLLGNPKSNLRFQFDNFKNESWDIEHVRSVTNRRPERHNERIDWLSNCLGYLKSQDTEHDLQTQIESFNTLPQNEALDEIFDPLYESILEFFHEAEDDEADDSVSNLTLLDQSTNRSYKNAVFAVKRQRLLSLDQSGIFVPLCTRNVFLKCYNSEADNLMFWSSEDRDAYGLAIVEVLTGFFSNEKEAIND